MTNDRKSDEDAAEILSGGATEDEQVDVHAVGPTLHDAEGRMVDSALDADDS